MKLRSPEHSKFRAFFSEKSQMEHIYLHACMQGDMRKGNKND